MNIRPLSVGEVENIALVLAKEVMEWDEDIPDFSTRYPNILESSLQTPFQTFDGVDLYPDLVSKAAILFYLLIKNHPFRNGNKRIAVTSLLVFLYLNGMWTSIPHTELYEIAIHVAESEAKRKDNILKSLQTVLSEFIYRDSK